MTDADVSILRVACICAAITAPSAASAFGFPGCPDLPEYNRALGTLQGLTTCGMTIDEARRVVSAHDGPAAADQQATPAPPAQKPRHRKQKKRRAP